MHMYMHAHAHTCTHTHKCILWQHTLTHTCAHTHALAHTHILSYSSLTFPLLQFLGNRFGLLKWQPSVTITQILLNKNRERRSVLIGTLLQSVKCIWRGHGWVGKGLTRTCDSLWPEWHLQAEPSISHQAEEVNGPVDSLGLSLLPRQPL